ncbi:hypothetical protein F4804DRAFT_309588 [Jackrogersella minutella]|nr:hypothetical protein F4804DRAFT_309588 [Jackrogersella minutella]
MGIPCEKYLPSTGAAHWLHHSSAWTYEASASDFYRIQHTEGLPFETHHSVRSYERLEDEESDSNLEWLEEVQKQNPAPKSLAVGSEFKPTHKHSLSAAKIKKSVKSIFSYTCSRLINMSERPLEAIKRATKAADRAPHLRKKNVARADIVDALDDTGIGGAYHHDGPYDATLASRNRDKRYAPVEAVKYGNAAALKATPREHVIDSLERHVPLQGTATIPPGHRDMSGRVMDYEEGADVMREDDAPGGPYKRWDHVKYHPNDLKGKGEPSYTIEEDLKRQKRLQRNSMNQTGDYEMQPSARATGSSKTPSVTVQRSASLGSAGPSSPRGKRFSDGIKRRIGSLRHKHDDV